jgi:hypothetical protein
VKVRFACPSCGVPARLNLPGPTTWQCPACDYLLRVDNSLANDLSRCVICDNTQLYKKKNFPHSLGLTILTIACIVSFVTYLNYQKVLTWLILGGTAIFDVALYLWVGDVVVCYRCGAVHGPLTPGPEHHPFDLGISERYRQEHIRREQMQAERRAKA